jgi:hypothetical protein
MNEVLRWVSPLLLLLAGITWALTGVLDSVTTVALYSTFTVGNLLGWVAILVALWTLYTMLMKK